MLARSVWRGWWRKIGKAASRHPARIVRSSPVVADVLEPRALLSAITVTTLADNFNAGDGEITLREALAAANTNASIDGSVAGQSGVQDEIRFAAGLVGTVELNADLGQLTISDSVRIVGLGAKNTAIDAQLSSRVFDVTSTAGDVAFDGVTITGGKTTGDAERGAGIRFLSTGTLTLTGSSIAGNVTDGFTSFGAGIYTNVGGLVLLNSLISGNATLGRGSDGAGIFSQNGPVSLTNSTLSGNTTSGYHSDGAAIYTVGGLASVSLTNSTVTRNNAVGAEDGGSGGVAVVRAAVTVNNSILTGNFNRDGSERDLWISGYANPQTFSASHSVFGVTSEVPIDPAPIGSPDANGNLVGTQANPIDALLAPLADNGGATQTHALYANSPAIDSGDNALAVGPDNSPLTTDQRGAGFPRINHGTVDRGSFEGQFGNYPAPPVNTPLVVTTTTDELDSDRSNPNDLSLREAIEIANQTPGLDTITFAAGLSGASFQLTLGQLTILDDLKIIGFGAALTTIDAQEQSRVFALPQTGVDLALDGLTVTGGKTTGYAEVGGAIRVGWSGTLTLTASVVSGNATTGDRSLGGAIYAYGGAVVAVNSLISGNSTSGLGADGGAIFSKNAAISLTNSTLTGSRTSGYHSGGAGIYTLGGSGSVTLTNSTVTDNNGVGIGQGTEGGIAVIRGAVRIVNSIVSGNFNDDGTQFDVGISGYANPATFFASHSILGVNRGTPLNAAPVGSPDANGNFIGTSENPIDARLAPLADNGGLTWTHALLLGSPAINAGDNSLANFPNGTPLATDQRGTGFPRIDDLIVDMGSYEFQFPGYPLVVTTATDELDADVSDPNDLSLREAIAIANAHPGLDTITFAAGLSDQPISLTLGQLLIGGSVQIVGLGARHSLIDAQQLSRVFDLTAGAGDVTLEGLTITGGRTATFGAAGGAIRSLSTGRLTILNSVVSNSSTSGADSPGGGIYTADGPLTIMNSTISGNSVSADHFDGGGVYSLNGDVTVVNSTISTNKIFGAYGDGGGIYSMNGDVTVTNSTITLNSTLGAISDGGGIKTVRGSLSLANSIVAGNTVWVGYSQTSDICFINYASSAQFTASHSLIGVNDSTGLLPTTGGIPDANGNFVGTYAAPLDARLGSLADNGGLTPTHALLDDSPAINAGDNGLALDPEGNPLAYDQRGPGFDRIIGGTVDMGAFESHVVPETPAFPREETLEGYYFDGNGLAKVLRDGDQLTIIDSSGNVSHVTFPSASIQSFRSAALAVSSVATPVSFDPLTGALTFSNGAVWNKVVNLAGRWLNASARETGVRQLGADLTFTNMAGQSSSGRLVSATQVIATDWGNIVGTLTNGGQRIEWANGTVWDLIPDLESNWTNAAHQPTRVEQLGSQLVFINRVGQTSNGRFLDATHVLATGWGNLIGTLVNGTIEWTNGTVWTQHPLNEGTETDLAGLWDVSGQDTRVLQVGETLTFVNRSGGTSNGRLLSANSVVATDWNVTGTISGNLLLWSNGTVWARLPELGGAWIDPTGQQAGINQLERALTFTEPQGRVTYGTLVGPNRVVETGSQRSALLTGEVLTWSNGRVWSQVADLRGSWTTAFGGAPTYVTQSGLSILMISDTGVVGRGKFIAGSVASLFFDGAPTIAVEIEVPGKSSLAFSNGWLWERSTPTAVDDVFADPNLWPFA